jgi:hypothetical protein
MTHITQTTNSLAARAASAALATLLLLVLGLILAHPAFATFEQVGTFGASGEGQLHGTVPASTAVNTTGAGGVPAGTVYMVTGPQSGRVYSYATDGEFREAWGWGVAQEVEGQAGADEFQRCGPDGEVAHPICGQFSQTGQGEGQFAEADAVAVDQSNGYVYVADTDHSPGVVQVFTANGEFVTSFGETLAPTQVFQPIATEPEKIYRVGDGGLAVSPDGTVYVADYHGGTFEERIMSFKPASPGDLEHYVYAGREHDINYLLEGGIALDEHEGIYATTGSDILRFDLADPSAPPVCNYPAPGGEATAVTVNPATGEVFYFSNKNKKIHQLTSCEPSGEFKELASIPLEKPALEGGALAFDPVFAFSPNRAAGTLYAVQVVEGTHAFQGDIFAAAEKLDPEVESESVSSVGTTSAVLAATVNPKGSETRYFFQLIDRAAYEANEAGDRFAGAAVTPVGGADLGSGQRVLAASAPVSGLLADAEYHYRIVAESHCNPADEVELCVAVGADQTLHTFPLQALGLPDGRTYEMVSPAEKHGGEVLPADPAFSTPCQSHGACKPGSFDETFPMQSAPSGDAVVYEGTTFSAGGGALGENEYLATRTESGWETTDLSSALASSGSGQGYEAVSTDLGRAALEQTGPSLAPEAPAGFRNLYLQDTSAPALLSPLLTSAPPNRNGSDLGQQNGFVLQYAGASADLSQTFFEANDALTGATPEAPASVAGSPVQENLYESAGSGLRLVNVLPGNTETEPGASFAPSNPISEDGSRVFWSSEAGQVYVRENGDRTLAIPDPGHLLTAAADGSKVLLDDGHLFNVEDLSEAPVDLTGGHGGFQGIVGQSEDLSSIFFVDTAVLDETENARGVVAQSGGDNLYDYDDGRVTYVATLLAGDYQTGSARQIGDWAPSPSMRTAEASPDGRWLAFLSLAPLTGYDNNCLACKQANTGEESFPATVTEAFLYDSATKSLYCSSCNPTGERPLGYTHLPTLGHSAASRLRQPSYLTDTGRLFFDTQDSLSPADTNGPYEDVYEYEPSGVGSCSGDGGCVSLISGGREPGDSNFVTADPSGANVFFTTRDQLSPRDHDDLLDLYDAREGGGIAAESETVHLECQGEACQPAVAPPSDLSPGSATFSGAGNIAPSPAPAVKSKTKSSTRAQKLAKALKACRGKPKNKRAACERVARKRYGTPVKKAVRNRKGGK